MKTFILFFLVLIFFCLPVILFSAANDTKPVNLGPNINTACDELLPIISPDGKTIYFCRGECEGNIGGQDIYYSTFLNGKWNKAVNIGAPLNNKYNNFVCSVTPDGNTLLLGNVYTKEGKVEKGVSISYRTTSGWSFPEPLNIKDYYNLDEKASFYLANDGKTLLMTLRREDTHGERDIYVSFKEADSSWSKPLNLGPKINSEKNEISPFLASDGVSLYFSSEGRKGEGGADVYVSRRLDNTWLNWSEPENLGNEINTSDWDAYYKITADGEYAYFCSEKNSFGKSDIFKVRLPEALRPKPVMLVRGVVINYKTRAPLDARIVYEDLNYKTVKGDARTNPITGTFEIALPAGTSYNYKGEAPGFIGSNWSLDLKLLSKFKEIEQNIELRPAADSIFCIKNVFFKKNMANLTPEAKAEVKSGVDFLKIDPTCVVEVFGHTDNTGSMEINMQVAEKRANEVANYILQSGIKPDRIIRTPVGVGHPVMSNDTEEGRSLNRRVEFLIYRKKTLSSN